MEAALKQLEQEFLAGDRVVRGKVIGLGMFSERDAVFDGIFGNHKFIQLMVFVGT